MLIANTYSTAGCRHRNAMKHIHYETDAARQRREAREAAEREAQAYLAHRAAQRAHPPRRVLHV
jgi:hypothetical protein